MNDCREDLSLCLIESLSGGFWIGLRLNDGDRLWFIVGSH